MSLVREFGEKITLYDKDGVKNKQITAVVQKPRFSFDTCLLIAEKEDVADNIVVKREKTNEYFILKGELPKPNKSTISVFRIIQVYPVGGVLFCENKICRAFEL